MDDTLSNLSHCLTEWEDWLTGVIRIEIRPINKHTDEPLSEEIRVPLELLAPVIREAAENQIFMTVLKRLIHDK